MSMLDEVLFNVILVVFPIFVYFFIYCYLTINEKKVSDLILLFTLLSSLYLVFKYNNFIVDNRILLLCNIPIVIAYIKRKEVLGVILSLIIVIYLLYSKNVGVILIIHKYILYWVNYLVFIKKCKNFNKFLLFTAVIQGFYLAFEVSYYQTSNNYIDLLYIFLMVFIFYLLSFAILYLFSLGDKIVGLYGEVKNMAMEREVKNSLFKLTHEVKNPIAVCKGYLDMLDVNDSVKLNKYIPIIKEEVNKSINIMSDFLEYSKIKIDKESIDINLFLDDVYDEYSLLFKDNNIEFKYVAQNDERYVMGDYNRLRQVFLNIIKNSIEAIGRDGLITLGSYIKDKKIYIYVEDNGCGMDNDTLDKIKDMFYTTKRNGTGIGVSLSNEIVKAHNGELIYESTLGKGTKTLVVLPLQE